jgi:hypothetical protein
LPPQGLNYAPVPRAWQPGPALLEDEPRHSERELCDRAKGIERQEPAERFEILLRFMLSSRKAADFA